MYPPRDRNGEYQPLPNDIEGGYDYSSQSKLQTLFRKRWFRLGAVTIFIIFLISLFWHKKEAVIIRTGDFSWEHEALMFDKGRKPGYLDAPFDKPLVIRLAIISRVDGFERRQALREYMLAGIKADEVDLDYRFFVGKSPKDDVRGKVAQENNLYNDLMVLDSIDDIGERISEKRYAALKWTNSVPSNQYDYSITLDSDTYCRFHVLAQRLRHIFSDIKPRDQAALVGRMGSHNFYFQNTVPDGNANPADEDIAISGPWYSYPAGIGYTLTSNLTSTILNIDPAVAHHIHYPSDDVMIGAWVAGLKNFLDPEAKFETTGDEPHTPVYPRPYYPYAIDAKMLDDVVGWHDFKARGGHDSSIGWESACIHRMKPEEMKAFRTLPEVKDEWGDV